MTSHDINTDYQILYENLLVEHKKLRKRFDTLGKHNYRNEFKFNIVREEFKSIITEITNVGRRKRHSEEVTVEDKIVKISTITPTEGLKDYLDGTNTKPLFWCKMLKTKDGCRFGKDCFNIHPQAMTSEECDIAHRKPDYYPFGQTTSVWKTSASASDPEISS